MNKFKDVMSGQLNGRKMKTGALPWPGNHRQQTTVQDQQQAISNHTAAFLNQESSRNTGFETVNKSKIVARQTVLSRPERLQFSTSLQQKSTQTIADNKNDLPT